MASYIPLILLLQMELDHFCYNHIRQGSLNRTSIHFSPYYKNWIHNLNSEYLLLYIIASNIHGGNISLSAMTVWATGVSYYSPHWHCLCFVLSLILRQAQNELAVLSVSLTLLLLRWISYIQDLKAVAMVTFHFCTEEPVSTSQMCWYLLWGLKSREVCKVPRLLMQGEKRKTSAGQSPKQIAS